MSEMQVRNAIRASRFHSTPRTRRGAPRPRSPQAVALRPPPQSTTRAEDLRSGGRNHATHIGREGLGRSRRLPRSGRRTRPHLHRPPPRPRGDESAGVRRTPTRRAPRAPPRSHDRHRGPQHADVGHRQADRRTDLAHADRDPAEERGGVRHPPPQPRRRRSGHRPRRRTAARPHAAGHDRRLRRLAHLDPRRVRGARLRHRHLRGRARPRDADAQPQAVQDDVDHRRRPAAAGLDGQGHHPRDHREDRHRRRSGLRPRIPRRGDPVTVDGGPDDDLQHVDRGRGQGGHGRPRRDDLRVRQGPSARP